MNSEDIAVMHKINQQIVQSLISKNEMNQNFKKVAKKGKPSQAINRLISSKKPRKVGYIVATCSPVTKGHIGLARQAADELNLDAVFFIIWPFQYIKDFHSSPVQPWADKQKHVDWNTRMDILAQALELENDSRLQILDTSQDWYLDSIELFDKENLSTCFWTGTWFAIRKIQMEVCQKNNECEFYFVCGADQFNPNLQAVVDDQAEEKVWKDYSLSEHLTINNIYAIPRTKDGSDLPEFQSPSYLKNKVIMGKPLALSDISATMIRFREIRNEELEAFCPQGAVNYIKQYNLWGYR